MRHTYLTQEVTACVTVGLPKARKLIALRYKRGIRKVNRVSICVEVATSVPPCALAISDAIKSPRPNPGWFGFDAPRANGLNNVSSASGEMGSPPFATESSKLTRSVATLTSIGLSSAPWISAFPSRLYRSWERRLGSHLTGRISSMSLLILRCEWIACNSVMAPKTGAGSLCATTVPISHRTSPSSDIESGA
jgi:hypothetical protein